MAQTPETSVWIILMPILTAIVAATATLCGVFLTNRSSQNRLRLQLEQERRQREGDKNASRLEDLYVMIGHYACVQTSIYLSYSFAISGHFSLKDARDKVKEEIKEAPDYERLEMMFYLYYPKLISEFDLFKAVVRDVPSKWKPCEDALEQGQCPTSEQAKAFTIAWLLIDKRAKELKKQVAKTAQS